MPFETQKNCHQRGGGKKVVYNAREAFPRDKWMGMDVLAGYTHSSTGWYDVRGPKAPITWDEFVLAATSEI
jgi:hypothetical protein